MNRDKSPRAAPVLARSSPFEGLRNLFSPSSNKAKMTPLLADPKITSAGLGTFAGSAPSQQQEGLRTGEIIASTGSTWSFGFGDFYRTTQSTMPFWPPGSLPVFVNVYHVSAAANESPLDDVVEDRVKQEEPREQEEDASKGPGIAAATSSPATADWLQRYALGRAYHSAVQVGTKEIFFGASGVSVWKTPLWERQPQKPFRRLRYLPKTSPGEREFVQIYIGLLGRPAAARTSHADPGSGTNGPCFNEERANNFGFGSWQENAQSKTQERRTSSVSAWFQQSSQEKGTAPRIPRTREDVRDVIDAMKTFRPAELEAHIASSSSEHYHAPPSRHMEDHQLLFYHQLQQDPAGPLVVLKEVPYDLLHRNCNHFALALVQELFPDSIGDVRTASFQIISEELGSSSGALILEGGDSASGGHESSMTSWSPPLGDLIGVTDWLAQNAPRLSTNVVWASDKLQDGFDSMRDLFQTARTLPSEWRDVLTSWKRLEEVVPSQCAAVCAGCCATELVDAGGAVPGCVYDPPQQQQHQLAQPMSVSAISTAVAEEGKRGTRYNHDGGFGGGPRRGSTSTQSPAHVDVPRTRTRSIHIQKPDSSNDDGRHREADEGGRNYKAYHGASPEQDTFGRYSTSRTATTTLSHSASQPPPPLRTLEQSTGAATTTGRNKVVESKSCPHQFGSCSVGIPLHANTKGPGNAESTPSSSDMSPQQTRRRTSGQSEEVVDFAAIGTGEKSTALGLGRCDIFENVHDMTGDSATVRHQQHETTSISNLRPVRDGSFSG
ncbi:unnamed protein product [Amoebophrya sp. A25]|nr:unnamed protein product [Amoebophrya sp. A25]|eukprot:GSA25T00026598001.1